MDALQDIELTYIGNDNYLSNCGTYTGDDVDAWCDGADYPRLSVTN